MKVARLCTFLDFGGVEKRFDNVSQSEHPQIDQVFLAIGHGGRTEESIKARGKAVHCFHLPHKIPSFFTIIKLRNYFKEEAFDVVHTSGAEANFHGVLAARLAGVKIRVCEEIGYPAHGSFARITFKWLYKLCQSVVVNAEGVKKYLSNLGEAKESQIKVIYNPCLIPEAQKEYKPEASKTTRLIAVSRLTAVKNLDTLINVVGRVNELERVYTLKLVGEGEERQVLEEQVAKLGLANTVEFVGFDVPQSHLLSSDIYVLPSHTEGFPNALMEAMALGMCCIATQVGGASDIIEHGVNGWLIDPKSPENIAKVLQTVAGLEVAQKADVGRRARETVVNSYSLAKHMDELYSLYSEQ